MPKAVVRKHIDTRFKNLQRLFRLESKSTDTLAQISIQVQLPKLAILELCGWIEETEDAIVSNALKLAKVKHVSIESFYKVHIKTNHSFSYEKFSLMLTKAIGYNNFIRMEKKLAPKIAVLKAKLSDLEKIRNNLAHTYKPDPSSIKTPETIRIEYLEPIDLIFKEIEYVITNNFRIQTF